MKHLISLFIFLLVSLSSYGQSNIDYIKQELIKIDHKLKAKGEHLRLSNEQTVKLTKVFESKLKRINYIESQNKEKDQISIDLISLEKEYLPRINAILNREQLLQAK
jgi:hypothetical protein